MDRCLICICIAVSGWSAGPVVLAGTPDEAATAFEAGDYPAAARHLERHLERHPDDADAWLKLGWTRYRLGGFSSADAAFSKVLTLSPGSPDALVGVGYVRLQTRTPRAAARVFRRVLELRPDDLDALDGLTLAALREDRDERLINQGLEAARRLWNRRRDDRELKTRVLRLEMRLSDRGEARLEQPVDSARPIAVTVRAGADYLQRKGDDGVWAPLFVKGFNLGTALPGRFPTEFPTDEERYRDWLDTMARLGANAVRLYTLLPPEFYRALAAHNATPGSESIGLIQGVWTELPPDHDFSEAGYVSDFQAEIARVIDAVHGNLILAPRPGHASGLYDTDVSPYLLAWLVGREWEPFAVVDYNAMRPEETSWTGEWLEVEDARPMECWVARMCDFAVGYEAERYRELHPVSFANWPTLDPLTHPTESTRAEEDAWREHYSLPYPETLAEAPWEDDRVSLDAARIRARPGPSAGFFASYHIYPNFPDFMNLEAGLDGGRDDVGASRYAAYLEQLKRHHGSQPVLVAEFGISTSRGVAHLQPQGWHHGGLDERDQGALVARMLRNILQAGYAGGVVFEFMDEWFKGTWSVAPLERPAERRRLWFNAESPEQSYGVLAARPGSAEIRVDGNPADWARVPTLAAQDPAPRTAGWSALRSLRVASDEGYVYLLLETGGRGEPLDFSRIGFRIAIDTYDHERGARRLPPPGAATVPTGVEFLVELAGPEKSRVRVAAPYEPFAAIDGLLASPRRGDGGEFVPLIFETNRERFARDGTRFPAQTVDRGRLRFGSLDPESPGFDTRADVAPGLEDGVIELRLPWSLLNVSDPSSRRVLHREHPHGSGTAQTAGFRIYAFTFDPGSPQRPPLDRLPTGDAPAQLFHWESWERPRYRLELKHGAAALAETMRALPATFSPEPLEPAEERRDAD